MIDLKGMVEDGILDLETVAEGADWTRGRTVGAYWAEGEDNEVWIETTTAYGITLYRWADESGDGAWGTPTLTRAEAARDAQEYLEQTRMAWAA